MSAPNRAALLTKSFKVLKKHYKPVAPPSDRSVLEHLLYASCLENSKHEDVDEVYAKLQESFFDWNEVRVTTVTELSEGMMSLSDPVESAKRLKASLQSIFETHYSFDIDFLKKQNLGKSVKEIEKYKGVTAYAIAYATQNSLGGHAIPVNKGALKALEVIGVITPNEAAKGRVPGMERAIPKSKGVEYASLLHQLGVDFGNSPFSPRVRAILLEIAPDAKERMPKRGAKKEPEAAKTKKKKKAEKAAASSGKTKKKPTKRAATKKKKKSPTKRLSRKKPR